jgi:hypothetical protein
MTLLMFIVTGGNEKYGNMHNMEVGSERSC